MAKAKAAAKREPKASPKPKKAAAKGASVAPPRPATVPPRAASVRPPPRATARPPALEPEPEPEPAAEAEPARWEQRADKDSYALDLLDRLVRYFAGRAEATGRDATRDAAVVLSTVSLGLAADDDDLLAKLGRAARAIRRGGAPD